MIARRTRSSLLFAGMGAFALASQTLLFREYLACFGGNELGIAVFFSTWLIWIALGASAGLGIDRLAARKGEGGRPNTDSQERGEPAHTVVGFFPLVLLYPLSLALQLCLIISIRPLAGVEPFELFPLARLLTVTFLVNGPVSFLTGLLFQRGCRDASLSWRGQDPAPTDLDLGTSPQVAARLYAFEALGGFAGGCLVTLLLQQSVPGLVIGELATLLLLVTLFFAARERGARITSFVSVLQIVAVALLLTPVGAGFSKKLDDLRWHATFPDAELIETLETEHQRVSIAELSRQTVFLSNGSPVASTSDDQNHAVTAALLFAQCPHAQRLLVIGLGTEGLIPHLLEYPVAQVDVVQVDAGYHHAVLPHYDEATRAAFEDPRISLVFADPRDFVTGNPQTLERFYDLVVVAVPDPDNAYLNRLFTADFYSEIRDVLDERGLFATQITSGENYVGTELARYGRSVFQSLSEIFSELVVTPGEQAWLFASQSEGVVSLDPDRLSERFTGLARREATVPPDIFHTLIPIERVESTQRVFEGADDATEALLNTDARPITLYLNLLVLGAQSDSDLIGAFRALEWGGLSLLLIPLLVFLMLRLLYRATSGSSARAVVFNGAALLATFGVVSISLTILLLLSFQNRFGLVFVEIGLLSALFMFGLFLGGKYGALRLCPQERLRYWSAHLVCIAVIALCALLPDLLDALVSAPSQLAHLIYYTLFLGTGGLCGLAFPVAGYFVAFKGRGEEDSGWVGGLLESVDHWGGALGAGVVGLFVVPVLGVSKACTFLMVALACIWALFLVEQVTRSMSRSLPGSGWVAARFRRIRRRLRGTGSLAYLVSGVVLTVVLTSNLLASQSDVLDITLDEDELAVRFRAPRVTAEELPFLHYLSRDADGDDFHKIILASLAVAPEVEGYAGPINLLVAIDVGAERIVAGAETIESVSLLSSRETPAYIYGINRWLEQFVDHPLQEPIVVGDGGVDVMSGATVTSLAVAEILDTARFRVASEVLDLSVEPIAASRVAWEMTPEVGYVIVSLILAVALFIWGGARLRTLFLLFNLLLAGLVFDLQLSMTHVAHLMAGWLPSPHSPGLLLLVVGVIVLAIAAGPIYCGYICPFGALQELLGSFHPKSANRFVASPGTGGAPSPPRDASLSRSRRCTTGRGQGPARTDHARARKVKYLVLAVALVAYLISRSEQLLSFDPLQSVFGGDYSAPIVILLIVIALYSFFEFRFWCRYLCPVGAFLSLFNKLGLALRWARPKVYRSCELGVKSRWDVDCIQCNRCLSAANSAENGMTSSTDPLQTPPRRFQFPPFSSRQFRSQTLRTLSLWLGILTVLFICVVASSGQLELATVPETLGETREVDVDEIWRQIQEGRLSDHEARFYGGTPSSAE